MNSFQVVLVTDWDISFVMFSYGDIQWEFRAVVGFHSASGSFKVDVLNFINIEGTSNMDYPGLYIFRVDKNIVQPSNFSSCEYLNKCNSDLVELHMDGWMEGWIYGRMEG